MWRFNSKCNVRGIDPSRLMGLGPKNLLGVCTTNLGIYRSAHLQEHAIVIIPLHILGRIIPRSFTRIALVYYTDPALNNNRPSGANCFECDYWMDVTLNKRCRRDFTHLLVLVEADEQIVWGIYALGGFH
ncbi:hypothetical protein Zmor_027992 [Zophobas morio]|uniref:Uncharacterized protein n=1 Tax=Zophobas morio TaxID=2755281 RepID=A0AA38HPJ6_9CUCU|nr:hypothetical protein Zmor_027992 [Zophobas morio]